MRTSSTGNTKTDRARVLIYGYGNPARGDDALGVRFADALHDDPAFDWIDFDTNYQLNIEDAENIADYELVLFADATVDPGVESFRLKRVEPDPQIQFTNHAVTPGFVIALCNQLHGRIPDVWVVEIRGHEWELGQNMTEEAASNLNDALKAMKPILQQCSQNAASLSLQFQKLSP